MKYPLFMLAAFLVLASCRKKEISVVVDEQREMSMFDKQRPINIVDVPPEGWRQIPSTRFRQINYVAGPNELVQVFIGKAGGDILNNATRWMGQFAKPPVKSADALTQLTLMDTQAYLLEAKGDYTPGMGKLPEKNQAMFGALISTGDGVLTVKMVGPAAEVENLRKDFLDYCKSLRLSHANRIESDANADEGEENEQEMNANNE